MTKNQRVVGKMWKMVKRNIWRNAKSMGFIHYSVMRGIRTQRDFEDLLTAVG